MTNDEIKAIVFALKHTYGDLAGNIYLAKKRARRANLPCRDYSETEKALELIAGLLKRLDKSFKTVEEENGIS